MTTFSRATVRCLQGERPGHGAASSGEVFTMQRSRLCRKARSGVWGDLRFLLGLGLDRRSLGVYHLMNFADGRCTKQKSPRPLSISAKGLSFPAGTEHSESWEIEARLAWEPILGGE